MGGAKTSINLRKFGAGKYEVGKQSGVRNGKDIKTNSSIKLGNKSYALNGVGQSKTNGVSESKTNGLGFWPAVGVTGVGALALGAIISGVISYGMGKRSKNVVPPLEFDPNAPLPVINESEELKKLRAELEQAREIGDKALGLYKWANKSFQNARQAFGCGSMEIFGNYLDLLSQVDQLEWHYEVSQGDSENILVYTITTNGIEGNPLSNLEVKFTDNKNTGIIGVAENNKSWNCQLTKRVCMNNLDSAQRNPFVYESIRFVLSKLILNNILGEGNYTGLMRCLLDEKFACLVKNDYGNCLV